MSFVCNSILLIHLGLIFQTPGKLWAAELQRRLLLPVEELHVGAVTDQQPRHLPPLLLTRGVQRGVAIPCHHTCLSVTFIMDARD